MIAYKLMTQRADGTLGPLFINKRQVIPVGVWLDAETHPRAGYAVRHGWHAATTPNAPHLMRRDGSMVPGRVWARVEMDGTTIYNRPASQGGAWVLAERMRVVEVL